MESKTCKSLQVNSCTLKSAYKSYDDFYDVGYKKYRAVCEDFNKKIIEDILMKAKEFKMPYRLGTLRIKKKKMNYSKKNKLKINWVETNKHKKVIYHLNDHTDGFNYRWFWSKISTKYFRYTTTKLFTGCNGAFYKIAIRSRIFNRYAKHGCSKYI